MCYRMIDQERVCMAATKLEMHLSNPLEVKFLAIFQGLQVCLLLGIQSIIVESDSLLAVQALGKGVESYASYNNLLWNILALKDRFIDCHF